METNSEIRPTIMERLDDMIGKPLTAEDVRLIRSHIRKLEDLAKQVIQHIFDSVRREAA